ncbi:MAG: transposase family protein, partial [Oscillospiraceae bacterium]|nr:transposase family protein [Oscillospiraceae bacterium]
KMVEILRKGYAEKHRRRGRTPKLSIEDLLLATLEYLREYRTYAHIAASYGIAESNIYRGIRWVEDTLIKDGTFFYQLSVSIHLIHPHPALGSANRGRNRRHGGRGKDGWVSIYQPEKFFHFRHLRLLSPVCPIGQADSAVNAKSHRRN